MRKQFVALAIMVTSLSIPGFVAHAEGISTLRDAVNIAGRQRMYTMRMLRDYIMISEKLDYKDPSGDLKKTKKQFNEAMQALGAYIQDPALAKEFKSIDATWQKASPIFDKAPEKATMAATTKAAFDFVVTLDGFVQHLAQSEGKTSSKVIDMAGRLRAVSQALASLYELRASGVKEADKILTDVMGRFRKTLDFLTAAAETQESQKKILADMEKIYQFFAIMNQSNVATPALAIKKTDRMLRKAVTLTQQYVASSTK